MKPGLGRTESGVDPRRGIQPGTDRRSVRRPVPAQPAFVEPSLDQPLAVIAAGPSTVDRVAVLGALLGTGPTALRVPRGAFAVVDYAPQASGTAFVPGHPEPPAYRADPVGAGPALARPPRRVELTLPNPLLRHFAVVDTPDTAALGVAGLRLVLDAVDRGGALLFVISEAAAISATDLELLAEVARGDAAVFFAVTTRGSDGPGGGGPGTGGPGGDGPGAAEPAVEAHRATLLAAVPTLADARWFALDPVVTDTACLRRALVDWSGPEGLRRASSSPPAPVGATRTVHLDPAVRGSGWADHLDRRVRTVAHRLRQHLALDLADIHLRCVQGIVFGGGCAGLPEALDRELHALSLRAVAECDEAVERILDETLTLVLGRTPDEGVRRRVAAAVSWGFAEHRASRDLDRVLLVTSGARIDVQTGPEAVAALAAYASGPAGAVLPPVGVALAGGCYQFWRNPANVGTARARSWLQRVLREVELELSREMARRVVAVQTSLTTLLDDSVGQGILLA